jgi:hypothetical protein
MLEEFRKINPKIDFKFIDPLRPKIPEDSLAAMGMQPSFCRFERRKIYSNHDLSVCSDQI